MRADFHIHSMYSDGEACSEDIFKIASQKEIDVISITDHDTLIGIEEHRKNAKKYNVHYISGIEVSAYDYQRNRPCHIIGLGVKAGTKDLDTMINKTREERHDINLKRIEQLKAQQYTIDISDFSPFRLSLGLYKQHIMEVLIKRGYAQRYYGDFYQTHFKNGGFLDYQIDYPSHMDAVKAIKKAEGIPILAHPTLYNNIDAVEEMVQVGLMGIEYIYPSASEDITNMIKGIADAFNLFLSGGSDYHGKYTDKSGGNIGDYFIEHIDVSK